MACLVSGRLRVRTYVQDTLLMKIFDSLNNLLNMTINNYEIIITSITNVKNKRHPSILVIVKYWQFAFDQLSFWYATFRLLASVTNDHMIQRKYFSRCQSAPKLMDSHSRSASPREASRPQHRPPSPPSPAGFDNRAYQHDEDPNHNDSLNSTLPQNGHKVNGDTKTLEAVNLELINLTPKNGAKKKDVEVDMNATNPYDEYFVPVNEHKKYMR